MSANVVPRDVHASIRRTAARALLESSTLNAAVAEILRAISTDLDWPLAVCWIAGPDDRVLRCRSIWASDALKRADVVEASRVAVVGEHTSDDPARRAYDRREPIWIEDLATQDLSKLDRAAVARIKLAQSAGLRSAAVFPICDAAGSVGAIELYASGARPRDAAMLSLMAEVGLEICEVLRREDAQATALEAVSRSRDELEQVLATLPDGITLFNGEGRIIYANDAAGRATGFPSGAEMMRATRDEIIRRFQLWDDRGQPLSHDDLPAAIAFKGRRAKRTLRYRALDGSVDRWALVEAVPILDTAGAVHRVVHIIHDMTNQHRVEQENVRLVGEAQEALRAREDLLAIVSHDLRNPLGVVLASTALLLKSNLPPDRQERARRQVEAIQRAGNRMNRLIRDLLDFASIQAGRLSVSKHPQDVAAMVQEVLEVTEPLAAAKSHRLVAEVAPELAIRCDHDRVIQLFSNLVGNAVKFTPDGGTITVRAAADGDIVRFSVIDTGPGIPPEELPYVFDRYYQAQRKNRDGIGLGLSIARGIVEAHGGRIWAESVEGQGSTFSFTLAPTPTAPPAPPTSIGPSETG